MAARDRYEIGLTCPKCGRRGTAEVSEDDHPYMRKPHFSVDEISEEFAVKKAGPNLLSTEFVCVVCGVLAR
jgi:hypothetical protein